MQSEVNKNAQKQSNSSRWKQTKAKQTSNETQAKASSQILANTSNEWASAVNCDHMQKKKTTKAIEGKQMWTNASKSKQNNTKSVEINQIQTNESKNKQMQVKPWKYLQIQGSTTKNLANTVSSDHMHKQTKAIEVKQVLAKSRQTQEKTRTRA